MTQSVKSNNMGILLSIILLLSATCYSTPGWAEWYILTKDSNVVRPCEEDLAKDIVIMKHWEKPYFVTNIDSFTFHSGYIIGKCKKGLFAFNEITHEVNYFNNINALEQFKNDKDIGFSHNVKNKIIIPAFILSFFLILAFSLKFFNRNIDVLATDKKNLMTRIFLFYLILYIIAKLFNFIIAYNYIFDPLFLLAPVKTSSIFLYSICLISPWIIVLLEIKKIELKRNLSNIALLFLFLLGFDFIIIGLSYYLSGFFGNYVIWFILFNNVFLLILYLIIKLSSKFFKRKRLKDVIQQ